MARIYTDAGAMKLASALQRLTNGLNFSVSFWLYRTATPAAARCLVSACDVTLSPGWIIRLTAGNLIACAVPFTTADKERNSTTLPTLNGWTHVLVTHNQTGLLSTDIVFYFNGKSEVGTNVASGSGTHDTATAVAIEVGSSTGDATSAAPARLGQLAIWDRALSPAEALALAAGAHPMRFRGLVDGWEMDAKTAEEGYLGKLSLIPGSTIPADTAVNPPVERWPLLLLDGQPRGRPRQRIRARYSPAGLATLNAQAAATLVPVGAGAITVAVAATAAATLAPIGAATDVVGDSVVENSTLVPSGAGTIVVPNNAAGAATIAPTLAGTAVAQDNATAASTLLPTSDGTIVTVAVDLHAQAAATLALFGTGTIELTPSSTEGPEYWRGGAGREEFQPARRRRVEAPELFAVAAAKLTFSGSGAAVRTAAFGRTGVTVPPARKERPPEEEREFRRLARAFSRLTLQGHGEARSVVQARGRGIIRLAGTAEAMRSWPDDSAELVCIMLMLDQEAA
jgi:hypothetical protein